VLLVEPIRTAPVPGATKPFAAPKGWHSRGYLPHCDTPELIQSVTFGLADASPTHLLEGWRRELDYLEEVQAAQEERRRVMRCLDAGHGEQWMRDPKIAELVEGALCHFQGERYTLHCWAVMPNHVHAMLQCSEGISIGGVVHFWKSYPSKVANRLLGRTGAFWAEDYFDRYIRDEEHYRATYWYIANNPLKAKLCTSPEQYRWSSAWSGRKELFPARHGRTATT